VAEVLLDLGDLLLAGHAGFVGDGLYAVLGLLHNVLVLQTLDVVLLALHVRVEERASLKELEVRTYFSAVASLEAITPS